MPDKYFCDTNIWVYAYCDPNTESFKTEISEKLITSDYKLIISNQVLSEFSNVFLRKYKQTEETVKVLVKSIVNNSEIILTNENTIFLALDLKKKYNVSFYDSLIISSALSSGCSVLYSEDMHHGLIIKEKLQIINPFLTGEK